MICSWRVKGGSAHIPASKALLHNAAARTALVKFKIRLARLLRRSRDRSARSWLRCRRTPAPVPAPPIRVGPARARALSTRLRSGRSPPCRAQADCPRARYTCRAEACEDQRRSKLHLGRLRPVHHRIARAQPQQEQSRKREEYEHRQHDQDAGPVWWGDVTARHTAPRAFLTPGIGGMVAFDPILAAPRLDRPPSTTAPRKGPVMLSDQPAGNRTTIRLRRRRFPRVLLIRLNARGEWLGSLRSGRRSASDSIRRKAARRDDQYLRGTHHEHCSIALKRFPGAPSPISALLTKYTTHRNLRGPRTEILPRVIASALGDRTLCGALP